MISTNNYICFVIIKTQKPGDCNLGPTLPSQSLIVDHDPLALRYMVALRT